MSQKVLIFPCGSEIGLEIYRSIRYDQNFEVLGASSVEDNGKIIFDNYLGNAPFVTHPNFRDWLINTVRDNIDIVFPAMDEAGKILHEICEEIGIPVAGHSAATARTCASKILTYSALSGSGILPKWSDVEPRRVSFPIFAKPDKGHGSRNTFKISDKADLAYFHAKKNSKQYVFCEYLPGPEYTVDCFTDKFGKLRFIGPRSRARINSGISARTKVERDNGEFCLIAEKINQSIFFRGAWFFQVKRDSMGNLKLLEVAARFAGSSAIFRVMGINFTLLTLYDAQGKDVEIIEQRLRLVQERSLDLKYEYQNEFKVVYVDYDDCITLRGGLNYRLLGLLYRWKDLKKKIVLISRHKGDLRLHLSANFPDDFFDAIHHIRDGSPKSSYIEESAAIFIDDSFAERIEVSRSTKIPVFSVDALDIFGPI